MKLSKLQNRIISDMQNGATLFYATNGRFNPSIHLSTYPIRERNIPYTTLYALRDKGLIEKVAPTEKTQYWKTDYKLTDKGRELNAYPKIQ